MLEGSGTTLISLFKNIIYMHQWLRLKICLKKISSPLSLIQPWGLAAGFCGANMSSASKGPWGESIGSGSGIKHHCSCQLLPSSRHSPSSALWSKASFHPTQDGKSSSPKGPGSRAGSSPPLCFSWDTWSGHLTLSIHMWKRKLFQTWILA